MTKSSSSEDLDSCIRRLVGSKPVQQASEAVAWLRQCVFVAPKKHFLATAFVLIGCQSRAVCRAEAHEPFKTG